MRRGVDSSHDLLVPIPAFVALFYGVCVERKARSLCSGHARHTFMWRQRKIARIRCGLASARQVLQRRLRERPNQGRAIIHAIWGPELLCGTPPVSDIAMVCAPHIGREQRVHWRGNSHGYGHGDSARAPPQRTALLAPLEYMSLTVMRCEDVVQVQDHGLETWRATVVLAGPRNVAATADRPPRSSTACPSMLTSWSSSLTSPCLKAGPPGRTLATHTPGKARSDTEGKPLLSLMRSPTPQMSVERSVRARRASVSCAPWHSLALNSSTVALIAAV